jgi:outer membrane lipoprotein SlyB
LRLPVPLLLALACAACAPDFSPNTYSASSVQQAAKVEQGVVVGVRQVGVKVSGNVGAATGGAAGAIAGSQLPGSNATSAFGALGGTLIGGVIGSGMERAAGDTDAFEYVVRTSKGELVSVTQTDAVPLEIGGRVLVIAGPQARIVADYTVSPIAAPPPAAPPPSPAAQPANTPIPAGPPGTE